MNSLQAAPPGGAVPADEEGIALAVAALDRGELIGLPTETVYGLAGDALDEEAVARIFAAKARPPDNPLIVHLADPDQLPRLARTLTPLARHLARTLLPGPLTMVVEASDRVPALTRAGLSTVALRVPDHPVAATVLAACRAPLAAPSANPSGRPSATRAEHVVAGLGDAVALVLDGGPCPVGVESTVVDVRGRRPVVLREGSITREALGLSGGEEASEAYRSPGTRYRHYAPTCEVRIAPPGQLAPVLAAAVADGVAGVVARPGSLRASGAADALVVATFDDEVELARRLYGAFHDAEAAGIAVLVVEAVPERGVGRAVMDRLRRAAAG